MHLFGVSQCARGKTEQSRKQIKPSGQLTVNIIKASEHAGADDRKTKKCGMNKMFFSTCECKASNDFVASKLKVINEKRG